MFPAVEVACTRGTGRSRVCLDHSGRGRAVHAKHWSCHEVPEFNSLDFSTKCSGKPVLGSK